MAHKTQVLVQSKPVKHSVQFKAKDGEKKPLFTSVYFMREGAEKYLGVKDLDEVEEIEITVRLK